jgi:hypothetical protein
MLPYGLAERNGQCASAAGRLCRTLTIEPDTEPKNRTKFERPYDSHKHHLLGSSNG